MLECQVKEYRVMFLLSFSLNSIYDSGGDDGGNGGGGEGGGGEGMRVQEMPSSDQ